MTDKIDERPSAPPNYAPEKIITEFTLTPSGTQKLQAFMDANYDHLVKDYLKDQGKTQHNTPTMKRLVALLESVLPQSSPNNDAKGALRNVLVNRGDKVVVIHGLPERKGMENIEIDGHESYKTYSFFLGNAIYEMFGTRHRKAFTVTRDTHRHKSYVKAPNGLYPHRDMFGEHIIFSAPYNGEHAMTEFIRFKKAVKSIPQAIREKIRVNLYESGFSDPEYVPECSLEKALQCMSITRPRKADGSAHDNEVLGIELISTIEEVPEVSILLQAVNDNSQKLNLQKGSIAVICEDQLWHSAHLGDREKIAQIPLSHLHSRVLVHNAGGAIMAL